MIPNLQNQHMEHKNVISGLYEPSPRVLAIIAGSIVFIIFLLTERFYDRLLQGRYEDLVAVLTGCCFVGGIFLGRILSQLWTGSNAPVSNRRLMKLLLSIFLLVMFIIAVLSLPLLPGLASLIFLLPPFLALSICIGLFIKQVRTGLRYQLTAVQITAEQSQNELQLLQSQLSPHFLFNTLNNLYGLSIAEPGKVPPLILQLSDLLRYSIYEAKELWVPLSDELVYIHNYIEFERIRLGERLDVTLAMEHVPPNLKIAPMLLIVFVENAFKHSKNTTDPKIKIEIELKLWGNTVLFSIKNTYDADQKLNNEMNKHSGLGLENVMKRLQLLYPETHELSIDSQDGWYKVMLQLRMK